MQHHSPAEEINATHRWIIGLVLGIIIQSGAVFFWAASMQAQVTQNTADIAKVEIQVNEINRNLTAILVGIEQVKGRLGIVESDNIPR